MLSIVIPVFNEGGNIERTLASLKVHVSAPFEVLIVYDLDSDDTIPVVERVRRSDPALGTSIRLVKNRICRGASGALRTGFQEARGDQVLVTMADLSDDHSQVEEMRAVVRAGYDLACPSRYCAGGRQELGGVRVFIPRLAGRLLRWITNFQTSDPTNSFRLYSAALLKAFPLRSTHSFSVTLEIAAKAHCLGKRFKEIPTTWSDRTVGVSRFPFWTSVFTYLPWFLLAATNGRLLRLPARLRARLVGAEVPTP